jgi:hypothetical protein
VVALNGGFDDGGFFVGEVVNELEDGWRAGGCWGGEGLGHRGHVVRVFGGVGWLGSPDPGDGWALRVGIGRGFGLWIWVFDLRLRLNRITDGWNAVLSCVFAEIC